VRFRGHKFGDGMCKCRKRSDVEDRERVFALVHTAGGQDDGDEVDASVLQQR